MNNIADTNEPTSVAVKMHRALFDDGDKNKVKLSVVDVPFSISRNLVQRKHEAVGGNNMEINKMFDAKTKFDKEGIESVSLPTSNNGNMEKLNHFATTNDGSKIALSNKTEKFNNHDDSGAQSFSDFFKSIFRCNAGRVCNKKINEQIESDYPLNLHLRMNEIFSMHDKLSDIAENLCDLYSAGRCFTSFI